MKLVLAFILLLALAYTQTPGDHPVAKGKDLINLLEGDMPGTYLVFFFDHNADKGRTAAFRKDAREQILARHPDIHYYEVDIDDAEFQDLVSLVTIDKVEVGHMPTFLIITNGIGYTVHGESSVTDIVNSLATKDWWFVHMHQRTQQEVEEEKKKAAAPAGKR